MADLEEYLKEAINNIHEDRFVTKQLLKDIMKYLSEDDARHEKVGAVASKYVETLQRSNEQLVKIAALMQKRAKDSTTLTDDDKEQLYDLIKDAG